MSNRQTADVSRRRVLRYVAGAGAAAPFVLTGLGAHAAARTPLTLAWNTGAVCGAPVAAAQKGGIFAENGLDVEFVNFAGSTEALLETIATGKADAGIGMALRWLKPLEQGFDVRIVAGLHSGCLRLLVGKDSGVTDISELRGKTVAISDLSSPAKHFFSVRLAKLGIDPEAEVNWRVFPGELLGAVIDRGEAQAVAHWDPLTYQFLKAGNVVEIATNLDGEYANRACCVIGVRNALLRENPQAVQALVKATIQGQHYAAENPRIAAEAYQPFSPKTSIEDLEAQVRYHGHRHAPSGDALRKELAAYTEELKLVGVIRERTNSEEFAARIFYDVAT